MGKSVGEALPAVVEQGFIDLLSSVEPLVSPLAQVKGIALSVQECDPSLQLLGDEERMRQILLNLVGNAIKFTPEGGWVLLTCEKTGVSVDIHVRDSGPGISLEKQQTIFDPFVQVDRRLNSPQESVGLGLAISRDLARALGGELSVESVPGDRAFPASTCVQWAVPFQTVVNVSGCQGGYN